MKDMIDFQLGRIENINSNGHVDIYDFRTGGVNYTDVDIEHIPADQHQPVKGDHVLFFTLSNSGGAIQSSRYVKIVKFFANTADQTALVKTSPIDLDQGESRWVSQKGNTIYLGNGLIGLHSLGQDFLMSDSPNIVFLQGGQIQIVSSDGTLIQEKNGQLIIKKGALQSAGTYPEMDIPNPTVSLTLTNEALDITGNKLTVTVNCKEIKAGGAQLLALNQEMVDLHKFVTTHIHSTGVGPSAPPSPPLPLPPAGTKILKGA